MRTICILVSLLLISGCAPQTSGPVEPESTPAEPAQVEPVKTETAEIESAEIETTEIEVAPTAERQVEAAHSEPTETEPAHTETEPAHTEPVASKKEPMTEILYTSDSLETVRQSVANGDAMLIDVRTQEEWDAGHLKVAQLIPSGWFGSNDPALAPSLEKLDKSKPIYVHCKMGGRAGRSAQSLGAMGYDVRPLKIKYTELVEFGFEEVK